MEMAHFLRTRGLCKRRLAPGRDIYSMKIELVDQCFPNKNLVPKETFRHQNRILQQQLPRRLSSTLESVYIESSGIQKPLWTPTNSDLSRVGPQGRQNSSYRTQLRSQDSNSRP